VPIWVFNRVHFTASDFQSFLVNKLVAIADRIISATVRMFASAPATLDETRS
jgi:hypothetical protein